MTSLLSKLMPPLIRLRGSKKTFGTAETTLAHVAELALRPTAYAPPKSLDKRFDLTVLRPHGWPVYALTPKGKRPSRTAIYVHGGAWIREITAIHWKVIAELAEATGTRFLIPIYPLAPLGTAGSVVPPIAELALEACAQNGAEQTFLMGDSAGASIAVAVNLRLRDQGAAPVCHTVLISPALDLTFQDPSIDQIAPLDPMLARPGAEAAAQLWRGDRPLEDPMVSPLFGDFSGLGPVTVFSGTHDMINADARAFATKAQAAGLAVHYVEQPEMLHVYPLLPIPEGKRARARIKAILQNG